MVETTLMVTGKGYKQWKALILLWPRLWHWLTDPLRMIGGVIKVHWELLLFFYLYVIIATWSHSIQWESSLNAIIDHAQVQLLALKKIK